MKEEIIEYYPNGRIKYKMSFYDNGNKRHEQYYDQQGNYHREQGLPDYHEWYDDGIHYRITYYVHGRVHNICNLSDIYFTRNGKIWGKEYYINNNSYSKLNWLNCIKNIPMDI